MVPCRATLRSRVPVNHSCNCKNLEPRQGHLYSLGIVKASVDEDVLTIRLSNPQKRNAISPTVKAERFIQTCLREWAYGRIWNNSAERTDWLPAFLAYYNARRPHLALGYKPPASRLRGNNLLQLNT